MREQSLEFRCDRCRMWLNMPCAMETMSITNLRKFFKWANQEYWRNEESTHLFFSYIPEVLEDLKDKWDQESITLQKVYEDPKFDSSGNYISDKDERERRRNHNRQLLSEVKKAKTRYERFLRRIPKLEAIKEEALDGTRTEKNS